MSTRKRDIRQPTVLEYLNIPKRLIKMSSLPERILKCKVVSAQLFENFVRIRIEDPMLEYRFIRFSPKTHMLFGAVKETASDTPDDSDNKPTIARGRRPKSHSGTSIKRTFRVAPHLMKLLVDLSDEHNVSQSDIVMKGIILVRDNPQISRKWIESWSKE